MMKIQVKFIQFLVIVAIFMFLPIVSPVYALTDEETFRNEYNKMWGEYRKDIINSFNNLERKFKNINTDNIDEYIEKAENGDAETQFLLYIYYLNKDHQDLNKSVEWLKKRLTNQNDSIKEHWLQLLFSYIAINRDDIKSLLLQQERTMIKEYIENNMYVCLILGDEYFASPEKESAYGHDNQKAMYFFKKAAEHGHKLGAFAVAGMYECGIGVEKDYERAVYWYKKAYELGETNYSSFHIAEIYFNGKGNVAKDYKSAANWYLKAGKNNNAKAQYRLAMMYFKGIGVEEDYLQGLQWLKYSADNGYAEAQYSYAVILLNSSEYYLKEDDIMYYLRMASKQGHAEAKELLRKTNKYQRGINVIKDRSDF